MRIKYSFLAAAVVLAITTPVSAAENQLDWPPPYQTSEKLLGMHIQDDFGVGMTNRLSKMVIPGPQPYCTSLDDPACTSLNSNWWILRVLPPCIDTNLLDDCVEGLEVTKGGETRKSILLERIRDRTWIADKSRGFPEAGSQGLWSDPFSTDPSRSYFINVYGDLIAQNNGAGPFPLANFFSSITPTSDSSSGSGTCIWHTGGRCGHRVEFGQDVRLSLTLHLSPSLTGWLGGRLSSPTISVVPLNSSINRITISGEPINVNVVGATIPYTSAPSDLLDYMRSANPGCPVDQCNVGTFSSGPTTFELMEKWKVITKDTASRTIPYWSVSRSPSGEVPSKCPTNGFVGLVTTNATAYQQAMPSLNGGELTYKVSGTHYMTDGVTLSVGSYNLLLRSDVARCVYGFSQAPIRASVSIVNESDVQSVATEIVNEKDGWMYLAANGFHFSQPAIKVKLSQDVPPVLPMAKPVESVPTSQIKKITVWCAKGNAKKKVVGANPVCPKGYKKIADPTLR